MLARFWAQALGRQILSEREREIVVGANENAPVGICFMTVTDPKTVKNRVHLDITTSASDRDAEIERLLGLGAHLVDIGRPALNPGPFWPTLKATSSALCARRRRSYANREHWQGSPCVI